MLNRKFRSRKGQALVEYAVVVAGVTLVALAGVSLFGHKVTGLINMTTAVLPGAHAPGNAPIYTGRLVEIGPDEDGAIGLDVDTIVARSDGTVARLEDNLWGEAGAGAADGLVPGGHED